MTTEIKTIQRIRADYVVKERSKFDELKALDRRVKRPAEIFAYTLGIIASLVLGAGMCLAMQVIGKTLAFAMPLGIAVGVVGLALVSANYPIYKAILKSRKEKYSNRIIELSDSLLNQ